MYFLYEIILSCIVVYLFVLFDFYFLLYNLEFMF